jgi:hypothetical protein
MEVAQYSANQCVSKELENHLAAISLRPSESKLDRSVAGKLLGDVAAVSAMLDRLLHHGHVLKCGPRSWRTKAAQES